MEENVTSGKARELTADECRKMLRRGRYCIRHDLDNEAFRIFTELFDRFSDPQTEEERALYVEAADGILELRQTDNEYLWERTGVYVADYLEWCEKNAQ